MARWYFRCFLLVVLVNLFMLSGVLFFSQLFGNTLFFSDKKNEKNPHVLLRNIFLEIKEMGNYEGENFSKREFFLNLDGNDNNKEEQVVILIHDFMNMEKMVIQVTYFTSKKEKFVKYAALTKSIESVFLNEDLALIKNDYSEEETLPILENILTGIIKKKKILKEK